MSRTRAERRYNDMTKALRKKKIADEIYGVLPNGYYNNLHQYSDNKIHCSCGGCSRYDKTNNKGSHKRRIPGNYAPSYNPSNSDKRKLDCLSYNAYEEYIGNRYRKFRYYKYE